MLRVFIVDDEPFVLFYLQEAICAEGHDPVMFSSAHEALAAMVVGQLPDLVITDLKMVDMNGDELLREMKSDPQLAEIPVVVISGFFEGDSQKRLIELGAKDTATKPITANDIREILGFFVQGEKEEDAGMKEEP